MLNRRRFVTLSSAAAAAALARRPAHAQALQPLPAGNDLAQRFDYVENVSRNAPEGRESGQSCANCLHYDPVDDRWGSCAIFPGFKVRGAGWCSAWAKK